MLCKDNTVSALGFISSYSSPEEKVETVTIRINQNIINVGVYERQRFEVQTRKYVVYTLYSETETVHCKYKKTFISFIRKIVK